MFKKVPHTYVIIFSLILLSAFATWIVPSSSFERIPTLTESGKTINSIVPHSYQRVEQSPQTWQIFSSFFKGFQKAPGIIAFILILGGAFWILNESKAIDMGVQSFLDRSKHFERYALFRHLGVNNIIITSVMLLFSFFGAVFGMSEETIAFVIVFVPMAVRMGYDSIVGVSMCFVGAGLGFAGCILNPFTLGIAQDIAGLKMFSGIEYRFVAWIIINIIGIAYVLIYANRIKQHPEKSIMYHIDHHWRSNIGNTQSLAAIPSVAGTWVSYVVTSLVMISVAVVYPINEIHLGSGSLLLPLLPLWAVLFIWLGWKSLRSSMQMFSLLLLLFTIAFLVTGVMVFGWGFTEIAALFFAMAVLTGIALGKDANEIAKLFIAGAKDILSAALVVGLAGGIIVILEDGKIIDTFLQSASIAMQGTGKIEALSLMYGFQSLLNAIITSGTAKAAMLMPIFSEISNMIGLSLQATVTAFHIGDGFTNLITPTSGVLIGVLEIARIPYVKWVKWAWKLILIMVVLGWLLLLPTVLMPLPGF